MGSSFKIGRLFGIQLAIDWSWIFIFTLMTWNLSMVFTHWHPNWSAILTVAVAILASLLFFASVLLHELAHSLVAMAYGLRVSSITLFLFGGVSNIEREPPSPGAEFLTAIVGPATSVALGITALFFGTLFTGAVVADVTDPQSLAASLNPLSTLLLWLGPVNILVGIFNLIPGFPLDGGRILRAVLWSITGDLRTSTRTACGVGQAIGWTFIILGIAMSFGARVPFFGSGLGGGLWLAFIGWFLNGAAAQSYERVVLEDVLANVPVWRLMRAHGTVVPAEITLTAAATDFFMKTDEQAFPVMMDGKFGGLLTLRDLRKVPQDKWGETTVAEVMTPMSQLATVSAEDSASEALMKMMQLDVSQLPVTQDERLIGLLRRRDVARWIELQVHPGDHLPESFAG